MTARSGAELSSPKSMLPPSARPMPADGFVSTAKLDHRLVVNEAMQLLQVQELFGMDDESAECTICWAAPKDSSCSRAVTSTCVTAACATTSANAPCADVPS